MLDSDAYLELQVKLFPSDGIDFNRSEIIRIGFDLSNQIYQAPSMFGTYYFNGTPCPFPAWANNVNDKDGAPQLKGARWFSYDELRKITNNFSEANAIGSGGYGKVYRALLPSCQKVAIKRAQLGSMQGGLEFKAEIEMLSRVHHKNQKRLHIALGLARGLLYLHELADPPIIHRDVKSSNILLDANLTAKVADFGLSRLVLDSAKGHISTQVKGTLLTEKSDVYSFGVVMLDLITARQPIKNG
ncbi:hypothetical protein HPP92_006267 [Vanilla planifolia]|uniref:Protein kinase domain-containing protein n=1 Tax=Vanilla planifolia TaxID=51239 RepID=A0A835S0E2_VANPL|nr:hypothetical protein HPP92_006267 [Vanilla planifolia]